MADSQPPKPVAPAEAIPQPPAAALDGIANKEPGMLDKAREMAMPYLTHAQQASKPYLDKAKPYTDAAIAKGHQLVEKLDAAAGVSPSQPSATPAAGTTTDASGATRDLGTAASTTTAGLGASAQAAGVPATAGEAGEKAKGMFDQISETVTSTFNSVSHSINEKTASGDKPGILTQVSQFAERSLDKVDHFLSGEQSSAHPVQTTTNSVPHPAAGFQAPAEPVVQPASTPAQTTLPIGVEPTAAGTIPGPNRL